MMNRKKIKELLSNEEARFEAAHPISKSLYKKAKKSLYNGVPMNWMVRWASPFPIFVEKASGAIFNCVDGKDYLDFCLGDTGAMTGHAPPVAVEAICERVKNGTTFMLPTEDAIVVGEELRRRFGLPYWQVALTATDANRFAIRLARQMTGRKKILVFNWCYHGTVDESFITINDGQPGLRPGSIGAPVDPNLTTRVVEFNDIEALEIALSHRDVACVLAEPVMTNIGIVHPAPGFHDAMRSLTKTYQTLLIIDETHTICTGTGGYTRAYGLEPDMITFGKPVGSGIPGAVYGFNQAVADMCTEKLDPDTSDVGGIGGTLAGNALSLAAMKVTLEKVLTEDVYRHTINMASRFRKGVQQALSDFNLPWSVQQLGCRTEYWFCTQPPRNGGEAAAAVDELLDRYMHLATLNRGILMTPFHNMALIAPTVSKADIDRHTDIFREIVAPLVKEEGQ